MTEPRLYSSLNKEHPNIRFQSFLLEIAPGSTLLLSSFAELTHNEVSSALFPYIYTD